MPSITIDGTPLLFTHGGVGRTTLHLLQEFERLAPEHPEIDIRLALRSLRGNLQHKFPFPVRRLRLPRRAEALIRRLGIVERLAPADLYHATDHAMPLRHPERAVATLHDLLFLIRPEEHLSAQHAYQRATVPDFARRARHILTCSQHSKNDIIEHLDIPADRITVAPWGINRQHFRPPTDPDADRAALDFHAPYILAVSCSLGRKNTGTLLDAWQALGDRRRGHKLVLVWNPSADAHPALALHSVHPTGRVSDADLIRWYGNARATLFPSHYEGFGLPVLESMSCGTPVITSNRSSLPEVGGTAAHYIDPDNLDSIIDALDAVISNRLDLPQMRFASIAQAQKFSWTRCARTTLNVYQNAIA